MNEVSWDVGRYRRCWKVAIIHHINYWEWMHWHRTPWSYFMSTVKISQAWNNRPTQLQYLQVIPLPLLPSPSLPLPSDSLPLFYSYPDFKIPTPPYLKNHGAITENKGKKRKTREETEVRMGTVLKSLPQQSGKKNWWNNLVPTFAPIHTHTPPPHGNPLCHCPAVAVQPPLQHLCYSISTPHLWQPFSFQIIKKITWSSLSKSEFFFLL